MLVYRPKAELTGKRLFAHTIASLMRAQGVSDPRDIEIDTPMSADMLLFLLRDTALKYWTRVDKGWLKTDPFGTEVRVTTDGLRKIQDRLAGIPKRQGVSPEQVREALSLINGGITTEPRVGYEIRSSTAPAQPVAPNLYPDEVLDTEQYLEGATRQVLVNQYERNSSARAACIARYGAICSVCMLDFFSKYGAIGKGFIHVHHIMPLAKVGDAYIVNPIEDLVPVCPNCHAMLHAGPELLSINALKEMLRDG